MRCRLVMGAVASVLSVAGCGRGDQDSVAAFRTERIVRGPLVRVVEASGKVTPRNTSDGIPVGAQVNGKVVKLFVDYNSTVTNGQVIAMIDPLVYEASYKGAVAVHEVNLAKVKVQEAVVHSAEANLTLAEKTYERKRALVTDKLASVADFDSALQTRDARRAELENAKASLDCAKATVLQSLAQMEKAKADLDYCTIRSPVNGVVIARKVEEGETVVTSYNTVPIVTVAEDLKTIWIEAKVPEADVGNIRLGQEVSFTADAYRRTFRGRVRQIRRAATTSNNVVTYPVVIEAENPDEMLFPGMTATLSIETGREKDAVLASGAALRFHPREGDLTGVKVPEGAVLWFVGANNRLEPVSVKLGMTDDNSTVIVDGDKLVGREAAVGYRPKKTALDDAKGFGTSQKKGGTAPKPRN